MSELQFRILPIGDITHAEERLSGKMSVIIEILRKELMNSPANRICMIEPAGGLTHAWNELCAEEHISIIPLPNAMENSVSGSVPAGADRRRLVQVSDLADLALAFWNEDPDGEENSVWETMHRCIEKNVPCIWVSEKDGTIYWAQHSLFEPFDSGKLKKRFSALIKENPEKELKLPNFFVRFLLKFGAKRFVKVLFRKQSALPPADAPADTVMENEKVFDGEKEETIRKKILSVYREYDDRAIAYGDLHRGALFWRAWLPFPATFMLAIAFYSTSFCSETSSAYPVWVAISAVAFLINAIIILASHLLAQKKGVQNWHTQFLHNRVIAEILRFYAHVLPFGITLPINRMLDSSGFAGEDQEQACVWQLMHSADLETVNYSESRIPQYLKMMEDYLEGQLAYHKRNAERYRRLTKRVESRGKFYFVAGVAFVIARGVAQFVLMRWAAPEVKKIAGPVANMCAMIIPAIASYYAGRQSLCGLKDIYTMDTEMTDRLTEALSLVRSMKDRPVNYSMIRNITEQIGILVMGDVSRWNTEMKTRKLKGL